MPEAPVSIATGGDSQYRSTRVPIGVTSFNPRPRTGGDSQRGTGPMPRGVSIRAPARGATFLSSVRSDTEGGCFNPRPRTGGDLPDLPTIAWDGPGWCFNPRPRTGGDLVRSTRGDGVTRLVSIRAPARGATIACARDRFTLGHRVSIRAPARGATRGDDRSAVRVQGEWKFQSAPPHGGRRCGVQCGQPLQRIVLFQSAPPHGGRPFVGRDPKSGRIVSIRAPARGATGRVVPRKSLLMSFNPRPRTGGDADFARLADVLCRFNPRPRTGGD